LIANDLLRRYKKKGEEEEEKEKEEKAEEMCSSFMIKIELSHRLHSLFDIIMFTFFKFFYLFLCSW